MNREPKGRGATANPAWVLFRDWCEAAGLSALPATADTIAAFVAEVPAAPATRAKRLQIIRRVHRHTGHPLALPDPTPALPWREGEGWLDLTQTLARCPTAGWPAGLAGRRDAYLAVLAGTCRLTRETARQVGVADITQGPDGAWAICGIPVERTPEPAGCPACALTRWLTVLVLWEERGRASVRSLLAGHRTTGTHACREASGHRGLPPGTVLLPGIDKHGWLTDWEPVSARTVSAILAHRQDASRAPLPEFTAGRDPDREVAEDYQRASLDELAGILEALDTQAAQALKASDAAIEETLAMLGRIGDH
ncbi:hypothetical protein [Zafaria cholistanensis]|uniref:hypothetical protein n=1 Tax=Zafaria cholistanensis TaxID=1682741 RepID=UPI00155AD9B8|nr:hypothetical protein [Zafaria cholistanensis]